MQGHHRGRKGRLEVSILIRLYHPNTEVYTDDGNQLELEVAAALQPILARCTQAGYAMRDVAQIISSYAETHALTVILTRRLKK